MPLQTDSAYRPSLPFRNGHVQTIYPALLRRLPSPAFCKERISTPDGDFIDLNWLEHGTGAQQQRERLTQTALNDNTAGQLPPLAILTHGLEGSAEQIYIRGMASALFASGWDVLAWNFRGCSGEPNLCLRSYHSGATDDLEIVIAHARTSGRTPTKAAGNRTVQSADAGIVQPVSSSTAQHDEPSLATTANLAQRRIALVGFSLGGNIVLKYLGQHTGTTGNADAAGSTPAGPQPNAGSTTVNEPGTVAASANIIGAVAISVPCDLAGSTTVLERRSNRIYMERFLKTLRHKIREKHRRFPGALDIQGLEKIRTFREFDGRYTAPIHGFRDADHYWHTCSCLHVIEHIRVPTLLLNAADDPFLSSGCFPSEVAHAHAYFYLETPRHGGHVGFVRHAADGRYYSELRACAFLGEALNAC